MRFQPIQNSKICWLKLELPWRWQWVFMLHGRVCEARVSLCWPFALKVGSVLFFLVQKRVPLICLEKNSWIAQQTARNFGPGYKPIRKHLWSTYAGKGGLVGSSQRHTFYYFTNVILLFMCVQGWVCSNFNSFECMCFMHGPLTLIS